MLWNDSPVGGRAPVDTVGNCWSDLGARGWHCLLPSAAGQVESRAGGNASGTALAPGREMLLAQGRGTGSSHPAGPAQGSGSSSVPWS